LTSGCRRQLSNQSKCSIPDTSEMLYLGGDVPDAGAYRAPLAIGDGPGHRG
jgi:hypothetical protein